MDEKKPIKISLSTFFLILAIVVIIVMVFFMYKLYNEKIAATQKVDNLNNEISNLESTVNNLQQKMDSISNTINSSEVSTNNNISNNFENNSNSTISLKNGNYTINEVKLDEVGVSNEECGVTLKENNDFQIYMGYGSTHSGKYEIKDNTLICKSNLLEWESGSYGSRPTDVIFKFDIINTNNLKLSDITINDPDSEKLIFPEGLSIGFTYSIK